MSNTEPKMIYAEGMRLDFENELLEDVITILQKAISKYGKDATIQNEYHKYDSGSYLCIKYQRLETEQEAVTRIAEEKILYGYTEKRDQAEFLRLSEKYAPKVT